MYYIYIYIYNNIYIYILFRKGTETIWSRHISSVWNIRTF